MIVALAFLTVCVLLVMGVSVAMAYGLAILLIAIASDHDVGSLLPAGYWRMDALILLAIPLFVIAGGIMARGGIASPLVALAELIAGRVRGGLSAAAVVASAVVGSMSGSAAATLTCVNAVMLPRLRAAGYPRGTTATVITHASLLTLLFPPSIVQIVYAWAASQSVLECFLATVGPGLLLAILLIAVNFWLLRHHRNLATPPPIRSVRSTLAVEGSKAFPALLMPALILGGIYVGVTTPTEAAGIAALYALLLGFFIYRGLNRKNLGPTLLEGATTTGVLMVMFFMVTILSRLLVFEDIPYLAGELIYAVSDHPVVILLTINLLLILIGMLIDDMSGILLMTPLLLPVIVSIGVDTVHFAAIVGINLGMANVTPPTAPMLYLGARAARVPVHAMMGPTAAMIVGAWLPTLVVTTLVPELSLWLPRTILG